MCSSPVPSTGINAASEIHHSEFHPTLHHQESEISLCSEHTDSYSCHPVLYLAHTQTRSATQEMPGMFPVGMPRMLSVRGAQGVYTLTGSCRTCLPVCLPALSARLLSRCCPLALQSGPPAQRPLPCSDADLSALALRGHKQPPGYLSAECSSFHRLVGDPCLWLIRVLQKKTRCPIVIWISSVALQ